MEPDDEYGDNEQPFLDAEELNHLLDLLGIPLGSGLPPFTERVRSTRLRRVLRRSSRIASGSGDAEQIALTEFHLGMYHFSWHEWSQARHHFERAREQAQRAHSRQLSCLSLFGAGCMWWKDYEVGKALAIILRVEREISDLRGRLGVRGFDARQNRSHVFLDQLTAVLGQVRAAIDEEMNQDTTMRLGEQTTQRMPLTIPLTDMPPTGTPPDQPDWGPGPGPATGPPHVEPPHVTFYTGTQQASSGTSAAASESTPSQPASEPPESSSSGPPTMATASQPKPHPVYFRLRAGYDLLCVLDTPPAHSPLAGLRENDWLIVKKQARTYNAGDFVVIGAANHSVQLGGNIRVNEECTAQYGGALLYAGLVEEKAGNRIRVSTGAGEPIRIEPEQPVKVGTIIGFFRYLNSPPRSEAPISPTPELSVAANCEDSPRPRYFWTANHVTVYCVAHREGTSVLPELLPGDWLLADTESQDPMDHDPIIVGNGELQGNIQVKPDPLSTQPVRFVGEFVRNPATGEAECLLGEGQRHQEQSGIVVETVRRYKLRPEMRVESVIGFFRYLVRQR